MVGDATKTATATTTQKKKITKGKPATKKKKKHTFDEEAVVAADAGILRAELEPRMDPPSSAAFSQEEEGQQGPRHH